MHMSIHRVYTYFYTHAHTQVGTCAYAHAYANVQTRIIQTSVSLQGLCSTCIPTSPSTMSIHMCTRAADSSCGIFVKGAYCLNALECCCAAGHITGRNACCIVPNGLRIPQHALHHTHQYQFCCGRGRGRVRRSAQKK